VTKIKQLTHLVDVVAGFPLDGAGLGLKMIFLMWVVQRRGCFGDRVFN